MLPIISLKIIYNINFCISTDMPIYVNDIVNDVATLQFFTLANMIIFILF